MADRIKLSAKHIVVVEGDADCAFLRALICQRGLQDFQVIAPGEVAQGAGGRAAFTHVLNYLPIADDFDRVEAILLLSDNDDDPDDSFREVVQAVQRAVEFGEPRRKYPVPTRPREKASGTSPTIIVYMVPGPDQQGNLETWCLAAAKQTHSLLIECIDKLAICADINTWSASRQAKAKVRSFVAVAHKERPEISLPKVWKDAPTLFPVDSSAFDDLANFLSDFPQRIAT